MDGRVTSVPRVLAGGTRSLVIPVYQRNYDWRIKHCAKLFDDIEDIVRTSREGHFFGAVVGHNEDSFTYVVIDGQQRLTTTSLLILALVRSMKSGAIATEKPKLADRIQSEYLLMRDENDEIKFKLKPVKNDNAAYIRLLNGDDPIESSAVTANYNYFLERLARTHLTAEQVWGAIERLEVMLLEVKLPQDDPQRIFESINSTGLELSEADKIRNIVLMGLKTHEQTDLYENYWNRIEKSVEYRTDWFIRLYLVSKTGRTPRVDGVYEAFRAFQASSPSNIRAMLTEMRAYADHCHKLNTASTGITRADKRLRRFNLVKHDVALPLLMPLVGELEAGTVSDDDFTETIGVIDTYIFRRFVSSVPTNGLNKVFASSYTETRRLRTGTTATFAEVLAYLLTRRGGSGRFPEDDEFAEAFATRDFYKTQAENRTYTFECLENNTSNDSRDIAKALDDLDISIEHIMPRTLTAAWKQHLGSEYENIHATWVNRIGNLTVTGYNSTYSNDPFESKKVRENGFADSPYRLNKLVKSSEKWTEDEMHSRTVELQEIALKYWPYPTSTFAPVVAPLPALPMGDDESFTNRVISAFEFQGERKTVASWKDTVVEVVRRLVNSHRDEVFAYAATDAYGIETTNGSSHDLGKGEVQVVPGLKVFLSTSTYQKLLFLRKLFKHLDIDTDELVIVLRNSEAGPTIEDDDAATKPYAELTKFIPAAAELSTTSATPEDTAPLYEEFRAALADFAVDHNAVLPGKGLPDVRTSAFIDAAGPDDILGALSLVRQIEQLAPGHFHELLQEGVIGRWLAVLV